MPRAIFILLNIVVLLNIQSPAFSRTDERQVLIQARIVESTYGSNRPWDPRDQIFTDFRYNPSSANLTGYSNYNVRQPALNMTCGGERSEPLDFAPLIKDTVNWDNPLNFTLGTLSRANSYSQEEYFEFLYEEGWDEEDFDDEEEYWDFLDWRDAKWDREDMEDAIAEMFGLEPTIERALQYEEDFEPYVRGPKPFKINIRSGFDIQSELKQEWSSFDGEWRSSPRVGKIKFDPRISETHNYSDWGTSMGYRRAKPFLQDEPRGTSMGWNGPIISSGFYNNKPALSYYDAGGVHLGTVTQEDVKKSPGITRDLVDLSEMRSQVYYGIPAAKKFETNFNSPKYSSGNNQITPEEREEFNRLHREFRQELGLIGDNALKLEGQIQNTFKGFDRMPGQGVSGYYRPLPGDVASGYNFIPQAVISPQLGLLDSDRQILASGLNYQFSYGGKNNMEDMFKSFHCCGTVGYDERIRYRTPQVKSEPTTPNDPYYFDPKFSKEVKKKNKPKAAKVILGSALKIGGMALGGGTTDDRTKQKIKFIDQWAIRQAGYTPLSDASSAWNAVDTTKENVLIAIIDSGVDLEHPDGPKYIWTNAGEIPDNGQDDDHNGYIDDVHGWNFVDENMDLRDLRGHGTVVAGIIAAQSDNGKGIAGINPGAVIMPLRIAGKDGQATSLSVYRAIHYAVDHGAQLINISFGGEGISQLEQTAINYANYRGVLIIAAAGNQADHLSIYGPSGLKHVLAVGALDFEGTRSTVTNWGPNLGLLAPGEEVYSLHSKDAKWEGSSTTKERFYWKYSGTSFSAPIVTATASLILIKHPKMNPRQIEDVLLFTAKDFDREGWDEVSGAGMLDAKAAVRADPSHVSQVRISSLRVNSPNGKLESVDVSGVVRGQWDHFVVELGSGIDPSKWKQIAGPFKSNANYDWLCRIDDKTLNNGKGNFHVRIKAVDKSGKEKMAQAQIVFDTKQKPSTR